MAPLRVAKPSGVFPLGRPTPLQNAEETFWGLMEHLREYRIDLQEAGVSGDPTTAVFSGEFRLPPYVYFETFTVMDREDVYYVCAPPCRQHVAEGGTILLSPLYGPSFRHEKGESAIADGAVE